LEVISKINRVTTQIWKPDELIQKIVDVIQSNFELHHVQIYLLDVTGALYPAVETEQHSLSIPVEESQNPISQVAYNQQPIIIENGESETRSRMVIPLIVGDDQLLGVLDLQTKTAHYFTPDDIFPMTTLATQIVVALQNINLRQQTQREQTIRQITGKIRQATNLQELVRVTAEELAHHFSADYALVELGTEADIS
jgi:GAF domain-containing protein